ncbi:MAG: hypothetical protein ACI8XB_003266 [Patiriisocius sp.]|jgi:hypothetical protein
MANPNCNTSITLDAPSPCNNAAKPDLELIMASNNQPAAYENVSFEIAVTNTKAVAANGVFIGTDLPDNIVLQGGNECGATGGNTNCFVNVVSYFFTPIAPGQTEILTVNFFTLDANPVTFYTQVDMVNNEDEDSTPGNGVKIPF